MHATLFTLSSIAALAAKAVADFGEITPAVIVVERPTGDAETPYENATILVHPEYDFEDPEVLGRVSTLYQVYPEYSYFCFAYKPDGTFYSDEWFGIGKPLHLSTNAVEVQGITCRVE